MSALFLYMRELHVDVISALDILAICEWQPVGNLGQSALSCMQSNLAAKFPWIQSVEPRKQFVIQFEFQILNIDQDMGM